MAISFVAAASEQNASTGTAVSTTLPSGYTTDDLLLLAIANNDQSTVLVAPSGWTAIRRVTDATTLAVDLFYKIATSDAETAPTATMSDNTRYVAVIAAYRGVDTASPFIDEDGQGESGNASTTSHSAPAITNTDAAAWGVFYGNSRAIPSPGSWTAGPGLTERVDHDMLNGASGNLISHLSDTAGVVATGTTSYSGTTSAGTATCVMWNAFLRPAGAGGTDATPAPAATAATAAQPAATVSTGSKVTTSAAQVSSSVPAATAKTGAGVSVSVASSVAAVPAPSVSTASGTLVLPAQVSGVASVPAPGLSTGATSAPSAVAAVAAQPASTPKTGSRVTAAVVAATGAVPAPTVSSDQLTHDTFNRANSTATLGTADSGQAWTSQRGTWGIDTNKAYLVSGSGSNSLATLPAEADLDISCDVTLSTVQAAVGLAGRVGNIDSHLHVYLQKSATSNIVRLRINNGGVISQLASTPDVPLVLGATYNLRLRVQDRFVSVWLDGVEVLSYELTDIELAALTGTEAGIFEITGTAGDDGGSRFDDLVIDREATGETVAQQIQAWASGTISGTSGSVAWGVTPTAGNLLLAAVSASQVETISGYTKLVDNSGANRVALWYKVADGSEVDVDVTMPLSGTAVVAIAEFSGLTVSGFTSSEVIGTSPSADLSALTVDGGAMLFALVSASQNSSGWTGGLVEQIESGPTGLKLTVAQREAIFSGDYATSFDNGSTEILGLLIGLAGASGSVNVQPSTVRATGAVGSPTVVGNTDQTVAATAVSAVAVVPGVAPSTAGVTLVPPNTVSTQAAVMEFVAVETDIIIEPDSVSAVGGVPAPAAINSESFTVAAPDPVAAVAAVGTPAVATGVAVTITAAAVVARASVTQPNIERGTAAAVAPSPVAATAAVGGIEAVVSSGITFVVSTVTATTGIATQAFVVISEPIYYFVTPSIEEKPVALGPLFSRMGLERGITVLKKDGVFTEVRFPTEEQIADADIAYLGGSLHRVTGSEATDLEDAGYTLIQIEE